MTTNIIFRTDETDYYIVERNKENYNIDETRMFRK